MLNRRMFTRILPFLAGFAARGGSLAGAPAADLPGSRDELMARFFAADPCPPYDEREWAKYFITLVKAKPDAATDKKTIEGWFASALMCGYHEGLTVDRRTGIYNQVATDNNRLRAENETLRAQYNRLRDQADWVEASLV